MVSVVQADRRWLPWWANLILIGVAVGCLFLGREAYRSTVDGEARESSLISNAVTTDAVVVSNEQSCQRRPSRFGGGGSSCTVMVRFDATDGESHISIIPSRARQGELVTITYDATSPFDAVPGTSVTARPFSGLPRGVAIACLSGVLWALTIIRPPLRPKGLGTTRRVRSVNAAPALAGLGVAPIAGWWGWTPGLVFVAILVAACELSRRYDQVSVTDDGITMRRWWHPTRHVPASPNVSFAQTAGWKTGQHPSFDITDGMNRITYVGNAWQQQAAMRNHMAVAVGAWQARSAPHPPTLNLPN